MSDESIAEPVFTYEPLLDLMTSNGIIDHDQVDELREEHTRSGKTIRTLLVDTGYVTEDDLLSMMASYQGCEVIDLTTATLDSDIIESVPGNIARKLGAVCHRRPPSWQEEWGG